MAAPWLSFMLFILCFLQLISVHGLYAYGDDEFEGLRSLPIEHSFESGPNAGFTKRGSIIIRSFKMNRAHLSVPSPLNSRERAKLREAAKNGGIYHVKVPVKPLSSVMEEETTNYVSTFVNACALYESGLSDHLILNVDQTGEVIGISMSTTVGHCNGFLLPDSAITNWNTSVEVIQTVAGPVPETQLYIEKMKREELEKAKGQQGDNRSFFAKYWMYIVPFVILLMVASNADPQAAGRP